MSEEHKALGHRSPSGSLAAQAQSAAVKHPQGATASRPAVHDLKRAALEDATSVHPSDAVPEIDLSFIGEGKYAYFLATAPQSHYDIQLKPESSCQRNTRPSGTDHPPGHSQRQHKPLPRSTPTQAVVLIIPFSQKPPWKTRRRSSKWHLSVYTSPRR